MVSHLTCSLAMSFAGRTGGPYSGSPECHSSNTQPPDATSQLRFGNGTSRIVPHRFKHSHDLTRGQNAGFQHVVNDPQRVHVCDAFGVGDATHGPVFRKEGPPLMARQRKGKGVDQAQGRSLGLVGNGRFHAFGIQ